MQNVKLSNDGTEMLSEILIVMVKHNEEMTRLNGV